MTDIYRDPTDGATARRVDLLRRRRDELVTMPHAIRRVVVTRGARIAASLAMAFAGALLVGAAGSARLAKLIGRALPPDDPAVIATMLLAAWLLGALVYAIARSIAEHRFAVAMTKCVLPGSDLHDDLERLAHEQPDDVARRMAHRLEIRSAALPVLAAAVVGPATLAYIALAIGVHGWPANRVIEHTLGDHAGDLILAAVIGLVATLAMLSQRMRAPSAAVPAGIVAATGLVFAILLRGTATFWLALPAFAIGAAIAVVVRKLRIERAWIETDDPAAGSELFAAIVQRAGELRRFVVANARMLVFITGAMALAFSGPSSFVLQPHAEGRLTLAFQRAVTQIDASLTAAQDVPLPESPSKTQAVSISRGAYGTITIDVEFDGSVADFETGIVVPPGWEGRVEAHVDAEHTKLRAYTITGLGTITPDHPFDVSMPTVCTTQSGVPIRLHVVTSESGHHVLRMVLQPTLRASSC